MPEYSYKLLYSELEAGRCSYPEKMFPIFASFLRTHTADDIANFAENDVSLASRLIKAGNESTCMRELYEFAITKKYSASRVRRALLFSYFGVTQEMLLDPPAYTTLLAANKRGCELLAQARKKADIPIITKPADYEKYGEKVKSAFDFSKKAAAVRLLTQEKVQSAADLVRKTPYIEK
jgi:predicted nucleotidyltransferase